MINHLRQTRSVIAHQILASVGAIATYVVAALLVGWVVSMLLAPMGYDWPRFAAEAAISTGLGMIASWRLTNVLFPHRSGRWIFAAFAGVVALVFLAGWNSAVNWLHTAQALFLVGLAYGLFWPHRRSSH